MQKNYLFYTKGELGNYIEQRKLEIRKEIDHLNEDYILNVSEEDLIKALVNKYILEAPILKMEEMHLLEPKEIDVVSCDYNRFIYVKRTLVTVVIPFEGDEEMFYYSPSTFSFVIPQGKIYGNELHLEYEVTYHAQEYLKNKITEDIQLIQSYLNWVKNDVDNFNNSLESYIRDSIKIRKNKLLQDRNLVSSLNIPIKKRSDAYWTYSIPIKPKKIKIKLPRAKTEKFKPEPTLAMEIYEDILKTLENMALVMERSPRSFSRMDEKTLRDHFLVQLNAQYEGEAMGEVFNGLGKTDILIRHDNNNVFIAECKFWKGEKQFLNTIDQILKYTTWRDTKTAILFFNKNENLSKILEKIPVIVEKHPLYKREIKINSETKFRYILHLPNDPNREIILTIMIFDIPKL